MDPTPVLRPHVKADEVDRRALVIFDRVDPGIPGRRGQSFAAGRAELRRRQRFDQPRAPVDPVAERAGVGQPARLVGQLPDHRRVRLQLRDQELDVAVVELHRSGVLVKAAREPLEAIPAAVRHRRRVRDRRTVGPGDVLRQAARPLPEVAQHVDAVEPAPLKLLGEPQHPLDARRIVLPGRRLDRRHDPLGLTVRPLGRSHRADHVDAGGLDGVQIAAHLIPAASVARPRQRGAGPVIHAAHEERLAVLAEARSAHLETVRERSKRQRGRRGRSRPGGLATVDEEGPRSHRSPLHDRSPADQGRSTGDVGMSNLHGHSGHVTQLPCPTRPVHRWSPPAAHF